ncbi:MAG: hypothetical protein FD124_2294, partial [Alphaproteobacteria bacterium]
MRKFLLAAALAAATLGAGAVMPAQTAQAQVGTAIPAAGLTGDWAGGYVS